MSPIQLFIGVVSLALVVALVAMVLGIVKGRKHAKAHKRAVRGARNRALMLESWHASCKQAQLVDAQIKRTEIMFGKRAVTGTKLGYKARTF